jgi:hypothetical protein
MDLTPMPLPPCDYQTMNTSVHVFPGYIQSLPQSIRERVIGATHRLAEVEWISCALENQIRTKSPPVAQEGLLSLQLYLLLTCADSLGHIQKSAGVGERFKAFFANLPQDAKANLMDNIFTLWTDLPALVRLGLWDLSTKSARNWSRQAILKEIQLLTSDKAI